MEHKSTIERDFIVLILKIIVALFGPVLISRIFDVDTLIYRITSAVALFLGINILIQIAVMFVVYWYKRSSRLAGKPASRTFVLGVNRIASVFNAIGLISAFLNFFQVNPFEIITSITVVAAAIALLTKDYLTHMINGLIILFSNRISLGDAIAINDKQGRVIDVTLINIILKTDDGNTILVPNGMIFTSLVTTLSKENANKLSYTVEIPNSKHIPLADIKKCIYEVFSTNNNDIIPQSAEVKISYIKHDFTVYKISLQAAQTDTATEMRIKNSVNEAMSNLIFKY